MLKIPKKIKLLSEEKPRLLQFRQFESLKEASEQLGGDDELLAFINIYLIEHDRKKLRYYDNTERRAQLIHYENYGCFLD